MSTDAAPVEVATEFGTDPAGVAAHWISEIETAEKEADYQKWLKRCRKIIKLYKEDRPEATDKRRFALFWSNIKTLQPAVYAQTPTAVVGRRWKDADPVGRVASEVLERALNYSVDAYCFDDVMKGARDNELLLGRGTAWTRYIPTIEPAEPPTPAPANDKDPGATPDPDGQISDEAVPGEVVSWEEVRTDFVSWDDFGHTPARQWDEVRAVWRRAFMTREELVKRFGEAGRRCPLDWSPRDGRGGDKDEQFKKAAVYEVWDSLTKQVIWVCKAYPAEYLDCKDDPLQLEGFFPCPRPIYSTLGPDSLIPVPDYIYYQDQVDEIDELTARIHLMIDALKVRGFYASADGPDLNNLLRSETNTLIPVDSWAALREKGGLQGVIEWLPLEMIASTLTGCFEARQKIIEDVYQVTGISDIMRGDTDPAETATAAGLKNSWGSSRVRDRQKELARFARDCMRLKAQVICNQFDPQILSAMTDVQLLTAQQKQQIQVKLQLAAQQAQTAGQPPPPVPPQLQQQLAQPTWDDVMGLLRNKALRSFRIDIETDSTIEPNDQMEKQRRVEFVGAVGKYLAESLPVAQASPLMLPVITEGLKYLVRGFRVGREMEDVIDRALDQLQQAAAQPASPPQAKGPDPQVEHMKGQAAVMQAQAAVGKNQVEMARVQSDHQLGAAEIAMENRKVSVQAATDLHATNTDAHTAMQQTVQQASQRELRREIMDHSLPDVRTQ